MSVVVCVKKNDQVFIGCDSQVSTSKRKITLSNKNNFKIWKLENFDNKIMMGGVGSLRDINVMMVTEDLFEEIAFLKDDINFKYMVKKFVPKMFETLKTYNLLCKNADEQYYMESSYIVVYKNLVFEIGNYGSVIEIDEYTAIGSGQDIALGSLNTTENEKPIDRIIKAIEASCKTNLYVNYPIIITSNNQDNMNIIESTK